jgi:hypothetical protein
VWFETTRRRPSVWRPKFLNLENASRRSLLFLPQAEPSRSAPTASSCTPSSNQAIGPISTRSSKRSKKRPNNVYRAGVWKVTPRFAKPPSFRVGRWALSGVGQPAPIGFRGWAFSVVRRVKGAWWPSRSSKPLLVRHPPGRGRFDSYPLRHLLFDFRSPIFDWRKTDDLTRRIHFALFCSGRRLGGKLKGGEYT